MEPVALAHLAGRIRRAVPLWRAIRVAVVVAGFACSASGGLAGLKPLDPARVKQTLVHRGLGMGFKITEADGTNVLGVLTAMHDDSFELTPRATLKPIEISYAQVVAIHNLDYKTPSSTASKVGHGIAIGAVVVVVLIVGLALVAIHGG